MEAFDEGRHGGKQGKVGTGAVGQHKDAPLPTTHPSLVKCAQNMRRVVGAEGKAREAQGEEGDGQAQGVNRAEKIKPRSHEKCVLHRRRVRASKPPTATLPGRI